MQRFFTAFISVFGATFPLLLFIILWIDELREWLLFIVLLILVLAFSGWIYNIVVVLKNKGLSTWRRIGCVIIISLIALSFVMTISYVWYYAWFDLHYDSNILHQTFLYYYKGETWPDVYLYDLKPYVQFMNITWYTIYYYIFCCCIYTSHFFFTSLYILRVNYIKPGILYRK